MEGIEPAMKIKNMYKIMVMASGQAHGVEPLLNVFLSYKEQFTMNIIKFLEQLVYRFPCYVFK
jgi:hypothetical protein